MWKRYRTVANPAFNEVTIFLHIVEIKYTDESVGKHGARLVRDQ
jgi:hypothetical protein